MKAVEARFLDFLQKSPQFVIQIYQRTYSWTKKECQRLWDDILRAGKNEDVPAHFIGSIVYIEKGLYQISTQSSVIVIDGQQRLSTILEFFNPESNLKLPKSLKNISIDLPGKKYQELDAEKRRWVDKQLFLKADVIINIVTTEKHR